MCLLEFDVFHGDIFSKIRRTLRERLRAGGEKKKAISGGSGFFGEAKSGGGYVIVTKRIEGGILAV